MISAFRAVFGSLFHSIHHFKNYSTRHSEQRKESLNEILRLKPQGATHVGTFDDNHHAAFTLAEGATQRICTRVSEAKLVPKTTLLRALQIQDSRHIRFCIAFNSCKILKQVQDDSTTYYVDTLGLSSTRHPEALAEGATHVGMFDNNRRAAFTLAEVLITLGIIGVVAALTIPNLISKYNEFVTIIQLKKHMQNFCR